MAEQPPKVDTGPLSNHQVKALIQLGWFNFIDGAIIVLVAGIALTQVFWFIFGNPTFYNILYMLMMALMVIQVWIIILLFRCMFFVLTIRAEINLMPAKAAQMVMAYQGTSVRDIPV